MFCPSPPSGFRAAKGPLWLLVTLTMMAVVLLISSQVTPDGSGRRSEGLRHQVREVCGHFNLSSQVTQFHLQHIFVDDIHRILYCSVPKASSSSWKRVWLRLTRPLDNLTTTNRDRRTIHLLAQDHMLLQPQYEDVWPDMLATYRKFMFVRHPFQRLVSAYRDKIEFVTDTEDRQVKNILQKKINAKYRRREEEKEGGVKRENGSKGGVSFSSFIRLVIEQEEDEVLLWDSHWRPIHQLCNPCGIEYDFIGKFENVEEDARYMLEWLGVEEEVGTFPPPIKSTGAAHQAAHYLHHLSPALKLALTNKFIIDLISFNYDFVYL